jgi:hypothetical protein
MSIPSSYYYDEAFVRTKLSLRVAAGVTVSSVVGGLIVSLLVRSLELTTCRGSQTVCLFFLDPAR